MRRTAWALLPAACLLLSGCKKTAAAPQLPPETTSGANTFGCLVDGQVFVPRDAHGTPGFYAVGYANLGAVRDGGYHLNIGVFDWDANTGVTLGTDSLLVEEGKTYPFRLEAGNAQASYLSNAEYQKLDPDAGQLTITRFDRMKGILAGRFDFLGTDRSTGRQVHVTDGRFDVKL